MTPEHERWAEAHTVMELHGERVFAFIAERVVELARAGDEAGVTRWREIADRVARLQAGVLQ